MASLWTVELKAKALDLYEMHSASVIAAKLLSEDGVSFSRNAVIGILHRASAPAKPRAPRESKPRNRRSDGAGAMTQPINRKRQGDHHIVFKVRSAGNGAVRLTPSVALTHIAELRCVEVEPRLLTFAELQPNDCRYPYGDGDASQFRFCGHPKLLYERNGIEVKSSYCGPHFGITYGQGTVSERIATRGIAA